jgi:hypothetical protein
VRRALPLLALALASCAPPRPAAIPCDPFCRTHDSDAWIAASLRVQRTYTRVLAVAAEGAAPRTVRVRPLALDARAPLPAQVELPVTAAFPTLQAASDAARGGDLVVVLPGRYEGFTVDDRPLAGDERYVHFQALGHVVIDAPTPRDGARWMIYVRAAHHVILEGFELQGRGAPGVEDSPGPWAGIMLDGDFGFSGRLTHHVIVAGNRSHHHRMWGLHATDTRTVLLQDNVFAASAREHGAYVSDGSDDYVIRRNVFFGNHASGLQVNLDPEASLEELRKHAALRGHPAGEGRAWALGLLREADRIYGPRSYPDGRGERFLIEDNVMNENGAAGGGALNLAGMSDSLIQNNLLYGNRAHGIAQWDNQNPYDRELAEPGPRAAAEVTGPEALPTWGCQRNVVRNNTVIMAAPRRAAFQAVRGSWGSVLANNVFINDEPASVEVSSSAVYRMEFGPNVVRDVALTDGAEALLGLARARPDRLVTGVTRARFAAEVRRYGEEPWLLPDLRPNPARPDFHPRRGSPLLHGTGDPAQLPPRDLDGAPRAGADMGALRAE